LYNIICFLENKKVVRLSQIYVNTFIKRGVSD